MKLNKNKDVKVLIAEKPLEHSIPMGSLNTSSDLTEALTDLVKRSEGFTNFIVVVKEKNGENYVELIEETGGS